MVPISGSLGAAHAFPTVKAGNECLPGSGLDASGVEVNVVHGGETFAVDDAEAKA